MDHLPRHRAPSSGRLPASRRKRARHRRRRRTPGTLVLGTAIAAIAAFVLAVGLGPGGRSAVSAARAAEPKSAGPVNASPAAVSAWKLRWDSSAHQEDLLGSGADLAMAQGQTWKVGWDLYLPATLRAGSRIRDLARICAEGADGVDRPIATLTVGKSGGVDVLEVRAAGGGPDSTVHPTGLAPLRGRWLHFEWRIAVDDTKGSVGWSLSDAAPGTKVYVADARVGGRDTWRDAGASPDHRLSVQDPSVQVRDVKAYVHD